MRALVATMLLLAACDAYDEDLGATPFYCGTEEPACPMGYSCVDDPMNGTKVCVKDGDSLSDFKCADDSALEPNDLLAKAVPMGANPYKVDAAICPTGDLDLYAVMVDESGKQIDATLEYAGGTKLTVAVLNTGGVPIAEAPVGGNDHTVQALAENLPAGLYYVRVSALPGGGTLAVNNYKLTILVAVLI